MIDKTKTRKQGKSHNDNSTYRPISHLTQRNYKLNLSTSGSSKNTTCSPLLFFFLGRKKELVMVMVMRNTDTQFSLTKGNSFNDTVLFVALTAKVFFFPTRLLLFLALGVEGGGGWLCIYDGERISK